MEAIPFVFFLVAAAALLAVPRKWAPLPLLIGCCYMTTGQGIDLGPLRMPIYRMLLAVGLLRVIIKQEGIKGPLNSIDKVMIAWAVWVMFASFFHDFAPGSGPEYAGGFIFNVGLVYFLTRAWTQSAAELQDVLVFVAILLLPIALEMVQEQASGKNVFSIFGGVPEEVIYRNGRLRASGPFKHPILAGTVGAVCAPLMVGLWKRNRLMALIGLASCLMMIAASASSGPIMSMIFGTAAVLAWKVRHHMRRIQVAAGTIYVALELAMSRPAYYVISMIDLTGSSTGYHRARLIESSIEHLSEWWLFGTDYTRHWMATGVSFSPNHTDITNYYLAIGVVAGLPAIALLVVAMVQAFKKVGTIVASSSSRNSDEAFAIWCLGAGLFAHAATSISVAYFDQSMIFFWLNLAAISSLRLSKRPTGPTHVPTSEPKIVHSPA